MSKKTICSTFVLVLFLLAGALSACGGQGNTVQVNINVKNNGAGLDNWKVVLQTVESGKYRTCAENGESRSCTLRIDPGRTYLMVAFCGVPTDSVQFPGDANKYLTVDVEPSPNEDGTCSTALFR